MLSVNQERKKQRKKQHKLNAKIKRRLFGHLFMAPCCYCYRVFMVGELTIEHVIPLCLGGTNEDSNIALACEPCNRQRGKEAWHQKQHSAEVVERKQQRAQQHYQQFCGLTGS